MGRGTRRPQAAHIEPARPKAIQIEAAETQTPQIEPGGPFEARGDPRTIASFAREDSNSHQFVFCKKKKTNDQCLGEMLRVGDQFYEVRFFDGLRAVDAAGRERGLELADRWHRIFQHEAKMQSKGGPPMRLTPKVAPTRFGNDRTMQALQFLTRVHAVLRCPRALLRSHSDVAGRMLCERPNRARVYNCNTPSVA